MENPARFDLNEAVRRWRLQLQHSPTFHPRDLDELEAHLRDSICALESNGFSEEESFLVSVERLGAPRQLEREFGKVNGGSVWMRRGFWMLAGMFLFWGIGILSGIASDLVQWFASIWLDNSPGKLFLMLGARWGVFIAACVGLWWFLFRRHARVERAAQFFLRHPLLPGLALIGFLWGGIHLYTWAADRFLNALLVVLPESFSERWMANVHGTPWLNPDVGHWVQFSVWLDWLFWIAALVFLARHHWKTMRAAELEPCPSSLHQLSSPEREKAQALRARGLSLRESLLLVNPRPERCRHFYALDLQVWIERFLWMVSGVLLHRVASELMFLVEFWIFSGVLLYEISSKLMVSTELALASFGCGALAPHVFGLILVCAQWGVVVLFLAGLWRCLKRFERVPSGVERFISHRPVSAIACLFLLFLGARGLLAWLIPLELLPLPESVDPILLQWSAQGRQVLFNVIGVLLMLWLGSRAMSSPRLERIPS